MKPMKLQLMGISINHLLSALAAGAAFAVTSASAVTDTWIAAGGAGGSGNWDTSSLNWNDGVTAMVAFADGHDVVFDNNAGGTITVVGTVSPASTLFSATTADYTLTSGNVSGTGTLTKSGSGTLILSGSTPTNTNNNSFTGKTTINAGTLRLTNSGGLSNAGVNGPLGAPAGADATIDLFNDSTFQTGGVEPRLNQSTDRPLNLAGTVAGTVTIRVNDNDTRFTFGSVTASGTGAKNLRLFMGNSGNGDRESVIFTGGIPNSSDASPTTLTVSFNTTNSAHLSLVGTNTFTGPISAVNANAGLNSVSTLTVGGLYTGPQSANGTLTEDVRGTGSLGAGNYAGNISLASKTVLNYRSSVAQTLAGVISGAGAVTVDGLSTVTMTGLNTYTGNTTVPTGNILALSATGGMTFAVTNASTNKITGAGTATLNGAFTIDTSAVSVTTGTWTLVDTTTKSFGANFSVAGGFTQDADVWTLVSGTKTWIFTEGTGVLSLTSTAVFTSFGIPGYAGVIDNNAQTIRLVVPKDTNLATLSPTYTVASGTVNQPNDGTPTPTFAAAVNNTVTYTLSSAVPDKNYAVTVVLATGIINYAVHTSGDIGTVTSTNLSGPNGVAAGVETWNLPVSSGEPLLTQSNLLDSVGATTGVGVNFTDLGGPDDWGYNSPLKLLWRSGRQFYNGAGNAGSFTITGLTPGATFDLWIATSHVGTTTVGDWTTTNTNTTGATVVLNNTGSESNGSTWVPGVNYVLFENIEANGSGNITMTEHLTTLNGSRVGFNGFQLIPVTATDYDDWMATFPSITEPADMLPTADPDGDGLTNQEEYAFGLDPSSGSSVNPITVPLNKTTGMFTYTRRATPEATGLTYTVQTSTDLALWPVDLGAVQNVTGTVNGVQTVEVTLSGTIPLTAPSIFVRIKATP